MGLITHFDGENYWNFQCSETIESGIYFTNLESQVKFNRKVFKIRPDKLDNDYDDVDFIKQHASLFVLTSRKGQKYSQYIVLKSASKGDIWDLAEKFPKKIREQIFEVADL